jgi:hypothetical protein
MQVLKGILKESNEHYLDLKQKVEQRLAALPKGSVKVRKISGQSYWYLQRREKERVVHEYLGKERPEKLIAEVEERRQLKAELKAIHESLRMLRRVEGKRRA